MQAISHGDRDGDLTDARDSADDTTALLDAVLADAPSARALLDLDLRCLRVNAQLGAITGLPVEAHRGRTLGDLLGQPGARLESAACEVIATGEPATDIEVRLQRDGGR